MTIPDTDYPKCAFWSRCALLLALAVWGWVLVRLDYRSGEIGTSLLHRPLLVFHEAGHVIFMPLGHWLSVLGGLTHKLGALVIMLSLAWAARLLWLQRPELAEDSA